MIAFAANLVQLAMCQQHALQEKVKFTWEEGHTEMALCSDSCSAANNGVCDEGRSTFWPPEPSPGVQVGPHQLQELKRTGAQHIVLCR